jgi:hypothetical protein
MCSTVTLVAAFVGIGLHQNEILLSICGEQRKGEILM